MPTYALLGATGATGSAILRCLLAQPPQDLELNIFVRSKSKLLKSFPEIEQNSSFQVTVIEGAITDPTSLRSCFKNADVIFVCVATNESTPGMSFAYDTSSTIIDSLSALRTQQQTSYIKPTILFLRAEPVNKHAPDGAGFFLVRFCLHHLYTDLSRASDLYESKSKELPGLFEYIFVDPPALHDADGTARTGHKLVAQDMLKTEPLEGSLSYADLGAAFCELAERRKDFWGQGVVVSATGKVKETWGVLFGFLLRGARGRVFG